MKPSLLTALLLCLSSLRVDAEVVRHQFDENVSFQAVSWHGSRVVATGTQGGIYVSEDNGAHWQKITPPAGTDNRQFRDNQSLPDGRLLVMSAGEHTDSGVFLSDTAISTDGSSEPRWQQVAEGDTPEAFFDCFYMAGSQHGWLYGDSDDKGLFILNTTDGGTTWQRTPMPFTAQKGEGGFASSGTCINGQGSTIVAGTGNSAAPRILLLKEGNWQSIDSPFQGGEASGIFSLQLTGQHVYAAGGSLMDAASSATAMIYDLNAERWTALPGLPLHGAVYGSALLPADEDHSYWISNPEGVAMLKPGTGNWEIISRSNIWSLACQRGKGCIGVGKNGVIEIYPE